MSDVEKAISGLVEDEELLHNQSQQHQQQPSTAPFGEININNYNSQSETGNSSLLQKESCHKELQRHQHTTLQLDTNANTNANTNTTNRNNNSSARYLTAKQHNCLSRVAKLIFSTPGLVVMVVAYSIMGAFIFPLLEAPQDISKSALIAKSREECLKELWIITEKLNVLYERNWTMLVHEQLRRFEGTIVAATRNMASGATQTSGVTSLGMGGGSAAAAADGAGGGLATEKAITTTSLGRFGGSNLMEYTDAATTRWTFSEALLYSVTVITTIGHGSLTPRTAGGKIATIFYALIGVPLMLMCLSSLGALLAEALQCTYARICCRLQQYVVEGGDDLEHDLAHTKHLQAAKHLKCHPNEMRKTKINAEKETTHQIKMCLPHQCDAFQEQKNDINCKNCKYDAIIGETNTNHGYDYKLCNDATTTTTASSLSSSSAAPTTTTTTTASALTAATTMTTMKLGHKEDCCQLLQNSPGKLTQHLSSCMQLKMSPTTTANQQQQQQQLQQQQQQHYYQQRPDVMLMTTGHKLSAQQPPAMATGCRMILPPFLPPAHTSRFYANATPAIATYHLVSSASANSSPTHHQSIRHYILPQLATPPPLPPPPSSLASSQPATSSTSVMGAQHFMAVPSTLVRFHHQTSPQTTMQQQQQQQQQHFSVNTSSNININPLAMPASGSATVYFPIVTPAAVAGGSQSSAQPLVKYHTIQMPHKRQHGLSLFQQNDLHDNQLLTAAEDVEGSSFPPPPPPAYQTATVHGIRRAKFLTKPLPQEINNLLHESDISCSHDLTTFNSTSTSNANNTSSVGEQQQPHLVTSTVYTPTTTATHSVMLSNESGIKTEISMAAETAAVGNFYGSSNTTSNTGSSSPASTATPPTTNSTQVNTNTNTNANTNTNTNTNIVNNIYENQEMATHQQAHVANNQTSLILVSGGTTSEGVATATVDIMEDEEEQEQQRLGNCPHGTPSRVPLLTSSSNTPDDKVHTRGFLNATAASLHRHTLNTFQRSNHQPATSQRKAVIINRKGECNLHIPKRRYASSAATCYGDPYDETSDDDCGGLEGTNIYKLKHLQPSQCSNARSDKQLGRTDCCDNHSLVSLSETTSQIPQVPIIVVLFILIFYVCLGTVIFALWENWSLIDGAYFCFVTLTTIGYGDFMPWKTFQGPEIQLFACCAYLLLGLVLVAMSFSILETQLIWKCKRLAVRLKLAKE